MGLLVNLAGNELFWIDMFADRVHLQRGRGWFKKAVDGRKKRSKTIARHKGGKV
jgi:hypothetical protein